MRDVAPDLMVVLGSPSVLSSDTNGAVADGAADYLYRWAPMIGIYGGHNGSLSQHDRPARARAGPTQLLAAEVTRTA